MKNMSPTKLFRRAEGAYYLSIAATSVVTLGIVVYVLVSMF